jgi:hypothetical protein
LIGSIRSECLDHIVVFGERHLRHVLLSYMDYYNGTRTHLSLNKDAPISRAAEAAGRILCRPILDCITICSGLICGRYEHGKWPHLGDVMLDDCVWPEFFCLISIPVNDLLKRPSIALTDILFRIRPCAVRSPAVRDPRP